MFWIWSAFYSNIAGWTLLSYKNIEVPNKIFCFNNQSVSSGLVRIVQNLSLKSFLTSCEKRRCRILHLNSAIKPWDHSVFNNIMLPKYFKSKLPLSIYYVFEWIRQLRHPSYFRINKMAVFLPGSISVGHEQMKFTPYLFRKEWHWKAKFKMTRGGS